MDSRGCQGGLGSTLLGCKGKEKHAEVIVEAFTKTFQRPTALNLEHRNLDFHLNSCIWVGGSAS